MAMTTWTLACIVINGTQINQVQEQSMPTGFNEIIESSDGMVDPTFSAVMAMAPRLSFKTTAIATLLGVVGITPVSISANVVFYYQQTQPNGTRLTGSVHRSATIAAGMVVLRKISAAQGGKAMMEVDVIPLSSDGTTDPITFASAIALPTLTGTAEMFTLGPLKINNVMTDGVQSMDFDLGIREQVMSHAGLVYPVRAHAEQRLPSFRWKHADASLLSTLGLTGLPAVPGAGSECQAFLRKMTAQSTRVIAATAQHIAFTFKKGIWKYTQIGGSNPKEQMIDIELKPVYDGTNAIVGISTASAIA